MRGALFSIILILVLNSCGGNSLSTFTQSQSSTEALYIDIERKINIEDFDGAISLILAQGAGFRSLSRVQYLLGNAYLGKCGFRLSTFNEKYNAITATQLFKKMTYAFNDLELDPESCASAQAAFESIPDDSPEGSKKSLSLLMVGFSKIGTFLNQDLDQDEDGVVEMDPCQSSDLSDDHTKQVITGLGLVLSNFTGVIGNILGEGASSEITDFQTSCEAVLGVGNCNITDPNSSSIDATMILATRALLDSNTSGFGDCTTSETVPDDGDGEKICCFPIPETTP